MNDVIWYLLSCSVLVILIILQKIDYRNEKKDLLKHIENLELELSKKKDRSDSYEVTELIHDLTMGKAIVEIKRIDPNSIFKRSVDKL